jgi:two-component system CheB/CheR fusion protein
MHVVGIGSSAGGLEALQELLSHLTGAAGEPGTGEPGTTGVAYVVAQHLAPKQPSGLTGLLARTTPLKVVTAVDGAQLEADHVFVCPPTWDISLEGDRLRLAEPQQRFGPSPSIDLLFESIAEHWQNCGVAIALSGTGSDGARGIRALRAAGASAWCRIPKPPGSMACPGRPSTLAGPIWCIRRPPWDRVCWRCSQPKGI